MGNRILMSTIISKLIEDNLSELEIMKHNELIDSYKQLSDKCDNIISKIKERKNIKTAQ
jgi:hypothetical protein